MEEEVYFLLSLILGLNHSVCLCQLIISNALLEYKVGEKHLTKMLLFFLEPNCLLPLGRFKFSNLCLKKLFLGNESEYPI